MMTKPRRMYLKDYRIPKDAGAMVEDENGRGMTIYLRDVEFIEEIGPVNDPSDLIYGMKDGRRLHKIKSIEAVVQAQGGIQRVEGFRDMTKDLTMTIYFVGDREPFTVQESSESGIVEQLQQSASGFVQLGEGAFNLGNVDKIVIEQEGRETKTLQYEH